MKDGSLLIIACCLIVQTCQSAVSRPALDEHRVHITNPQELKTDSVHVTGVTDGVQTVKVLNAWEAKGDCTCH